MCNTCWYVRVYSRVHSRTDVREDASHDSVNKPTDGTCVVVERCSIVCRMRFIGQIGSVAQLSDIGRNNNENRPRVNSFFIVNIRFIVIEIINKDILSTFFR